MAGFSPRPASEGKVKRPSTVRIIGGRWKRTALHVAGLPDLRPTPDRVRETVFNWLTHQFGGSLEGISVLDLFAGSGAMGFEAASRGAARVVLVDRNAAAVAALIDAKERLKADAIEVIRSDALAAARSYRRSDAKTESQVDSGSEETAGGFDLVFVDPPYRQQWLERVLPLAPRLLSRHGIVYAEAEAPLDATTVNTFGLELVRADKAGQVFYHLLRPALVQTAHIETQAQHENPP